MDSSEFVVSAEALLRVIIALLYLPIVLFSLPLADPPPVRQ